MSEFVEFEVDDPERFTALQRVFLEIKKDKDAGAFRESEEWLHVFDDEAKGHFSFSSFDAGDDEGEERPIAIPSVLETTGLQWDFLSLIDAFQNGEYELRTCEMTGPATARLTFFSLAYPYGGVACMVALIEAHGFRVTGIDDGTGYEAL